MSDKKIKLTINLHSLLYNHDENAIEILRQLGKLEKYNKLLNKEPKESVVNKINIVVHENDSIDYIKRKLTLDLFERIKDTKNNNTCFYCFDEHKDNEIITLTKDVKIKEEQEKFISTDDIEVSDDDDISDVEIDDEDLLLDSDEDIDDDIDALLDEVDDINLEIEQFGGAKTKKKVFVCHNCKKIYLFENYYDVKYFNEYNDIFPLPELLYFWKNDKQIGHSYNKKVFGKRTDINLTIDGNDYVSPYANLEEVSRKIYNVKSYKGNELVLLFNNFISEDKKHYNKLSNDSFSLVNDVVNDGNYTFNLAYFPELSLYYNQGNNKYKCLDVYSLLYWPYVDFGTYFIKYILKKDANNNNFNSCRRVEFNFDINKYSTEELILGWGKKYKKYENILEKFNAIKQKNSKDDLFTSKVFFKINDDPDEKLNLAINFNNVYHLFELDDEIPYLTLYLPEEAVYLEKIFRNKEDLPKKLGWSLNKKNIIQFKILLSKKIKTLDGKIPDDIYFQVNLYENKKIEVSVSFQTDMNIFITKEYLSIINEQVNGLIKRLNSFHIFNNKDKINLSTKDVNMWGENSNTQINSMNFFMKMKTNTTIDDIPKLTNCLYPYLYFDNNLKIKNSYRYIRLKQTKTTDIIDKFIYNEASKIIQELNIDNEKEIEDLLLKQIQDVYNKNIEESITLIKTYLNKYHNFSVKPISFGVFLIISEPGEWISPRKNENTYKVSVLGVRNFRELKVLKEFNEKLFKVLNENTEDVKSFKKECNFDELQKVDKFILQKDELEMLRVEKKQCGFRLNEIEENKETGKEKKLINKRIKYLDKVIKGKIDNLKKGKGKNYVRYLTRLQEAYPNLGMVCDKCNTPLEKKTQYCKVCDNKNVSINKYSKQCQKKRQPIGTGSGNNPEIIEFNYEREKARLEELANIQCNIKLDDKKKSTPKKKKPQKGGSTKKLYDTSFYEKWGLENNPSLYKDLLKIENCNNNPKSGKPGYKIKELKKIAEHYDIDTKKKSKEQICQILKSKVIKQDIIGDEFKFKMVMNESKNYNFNKNFKETELKKIFKQVGLKYDSNSDVRDNQKIFTELLTNMFNDDIYKKHKDGFVKLFGFDTIVTEISSNDEIIDKENYLKQRIHYEIFKSYDFDEYDILYIFNILIETNSEMSSNNAYGMSQSNTPSENKKLMEEYFTNYKKNELDYSLPTEENKFDKFLKESGMLARKDNNNNVVESVLSYKGKAISCSNYDDTDGNSMVGFLDIPNITDKSMSDKKIRDLYCQPCCFINKKDKKTNKIIIPNTYRRNVLFCTGKINWDDYQKILESEEKIENYISTTVSVNTYNTFGKLQGGLHAFFNNYSNLYNLRKGTNIKSQFFTKFQNNILKDSGFTLFGIKQGNNSILNLLSECLNMPSEAIVLAIQRGLNKQPDIFKTLNNGKILLKFKTIAKYVEYLKGEELKEKRYIIDIISRPGIFKKYPNGINMITFMLTDNEIVLEKPENIYINDYFNVKNHNIYLFKYSETIYEPIILKYPGKKNFKGVFTIGDEDKEFNKYKINKNMIDNLIETIYIWFKKSFEEYFVTAIGLIKKLRENKKNDFIPVKQLIDNFNRVNYILTDGGYLLPIRYTTLDLTLKYENINNINKYIKSFDETKKYMKDFSKLIKDDDYMYSKVITEGNTVVAIELDNELFIPITKMKYEKGLSKSKNIMFFDINNALYNNKVPEKNQIFKKEDFESELYERLKLEFAHYINKHEFLKDNINKIITQKEKINRFIKDIKTTRDIKIDNYRKELLEIVTLVIDKIAKIQEIKKYETENKNNNIRGVCATKSTNSCEVDNYCVLDNNVCKVKIPDDKQYFFIGLLTEELLQNNQNTQSILNNNLNVIKDYNILNDTDTMIFRKRRDISF
jgi:hypothetical protein